MWLSLPRVELQTRSPSILVSQLLCLIIPYSIIVCFTIVSMKSSHWLTPSPGTEETCKRNSITGTKMWCESQRQNRQVGRPKNTSRQHWWSQSKSNRQTREAGTRCAKQAGIWCKEKYFLFEATEQSTRTGCNSKPPPCATPSAMPLGKDATHEICQGRENNIGRSD